MSRTSKDRSAWTITVLVAAATIGCGGYGVVSETAYDYATALYSVANREAASQLESLAAQIDAATAAGELTAAESQWLGAMLADARDGDWAAARAAARRLMEDQVRTRSQSES